MSDNVLDLPPRGPARHRAILAAREQYIDDNLRRPGDGVWIDGDEMQAGVAKIIGDEVSADDLKAAVQWWNAELQNQFQERYDMPSVKLAQQIEKHKAPLEAFAESFTQLLTVHHAAMPVPPEQRDEDLFLMRWLGELQAQAELMHEFCQRAPSTLHVMRDDLESSFRYWQPRMDETLRVAWRTMIEKHNCVLAMLGRIPDTTKGGHRPTVDTPPPKAQPRPERPEQP